ncbi:MAG: hypothetical protein KGP14_06735 [Betaproteobacteria bacterium]|nr:hypothetical protein [Betaproteobacteria bacterium]
MATVSQTSNYFGPVPAGELFVEAELEKVGRTLINARATLRDGTGTLFPAPRLLLR